MKHILLHSLILASLSFTIGCASRKDENPIRPPQSNTLHQKEIYSRLKRERIPYPDNVVYRSDRKEQKAFDTGFRLGWERAISSANLDASLWDPEPPDERQEAWQAGIESGMKAGRERWMQEFTSLRRASGADDAMGMGVMPPMP